MGLKCSQKKIRIGLVPQTAPGRGPGPRRGSGGFLSCPQQVRGRGQVPVGLRWFQASWALGGGDPDPADRVTAAALPFLRSPAGHSLASPLGIPTSSLLLCQGSQQNKLLPGLVFKAKGFLPVRTRGHSPRSPSFSSLSYQRLLGREDKVGGWCCTWWW